MSTSKKQKRSAEKTSRRSEGVDVVLKRSNSGQFVVKRSDAGSFSKVTTLGRDPAPPSDRAAAKKSSRQRAGADAIDRPFDPAVLRRAREIADTYQVVVRREDGEFVGRGLELPECIGTGETPGECVDDARGLMTTSVAVMLEQGETPPPPAGEGARTEQVNIRFSAEEKLALETAARQQGFRGVSDYVRAAALSGKRLNP